MSGGSYDYACFVADLEDLIQRHRGLDELADRLAGLDERQFPGAKAAAVATRALLVRRQLWEAHVAAVAQVLGPVWKAVEWRDSGDWGDDRIVEALAVMLDGEVGQP